MRELFGNIEFKDYFGDRLIGDAGNFYVIIPKNVSDPIPLFCPVCGCSMSTKDDIDSHRNVGCCVHCRETWYYPNKDKWNTGWRPQVKNQCKYMKTVIIT